MQAPLLEGSVITGRSGVEGDLCAVAGSARRRRPAPGCCESLATTFCARRHLSYAAVSDAAATAADALVSELSLMSPITTTAAVSPGGGSDGGRDPRAVDALQRVWAAVASESPAAGAAAMRLVPPRLPHRDWRRLGFQGDDPCTDMRGSGLAGFLYMARLAEECAEARAIASAGEAAGELPFGVAALNVLWMLRCHLMLFRDPPSYCPCCGAAVREEYGPRQPHRGRHIRGFAMLLLDDRDAWMHVYAQTFLLTAALWRRRGTQQQEQSGSLQADGTDEKVCGETACAPAGSHGGDKCSSAGGRDRVTLPPLGAKLSFSAAEVASAVSADGAGDGAGATSSAASTFSGDAGRAATAATITAPLAASPHATSSGRNTRSVGSSRSAGGGSSSGGALTVVVADARLLEFNALLRQARGLVLEALAAFPSDVAALRASLFRRARSSSQVTGAAAAGLGASDALLGAAPPAQSLYPQLPPPSAGVAASPTKSSDAPLRRGSSPAFGPVASRYGGAGARR